MPVKARSVKRRTVSGVQRTPRDPDGTRQALLDSALKLFGTEGYHATSVQKIVDEARLTKGAFYYHFETKEDVLREIHDRFIDFQLRRLKSVLAEGGSANELVRR